PKPGILFRDITTLLADARAFRRAVDELVHPWAGNKIDKVAGIEARGFILGGAVAHQVSAGFVPIRKKGKLPHTTVRIAYSQDFRRVDVAWKEALDSQLLRGDVLWWSQGCDRGEQLERRVAFAEMHRQHRRGRRGWRSRHGLAHVLVAAQPYQQGCRFLGSV